MVLFVAMTVSQPARAASGECEVTAVIPRVECGNDDYRKAGLYAEWWRPLVALYFEPADVDRAMCLMDLESSGDPDARNTSTGAAGLMQVMPFWAEATGYRYAELFDPGINIWVARQIRDQQGWRAWSPYVRGSCR